MSQADILAKVAAGELSVEAATKALAEAQQPRRGLYCKVSPKRALSVYGLQRMPVTLYAEQWERLLDFAEDIRGFIRDNDAQLDRKERKG